MTQAQRSAPRRAAGVVLAAMAGMLALAGCSATHVGESWQCPLAQGAECTSVAAADPAVPDAAGEAPVLRAPLYEARGSEPPAAPAPPCDAGCAGFDPLAWLARLLGAEEDGGEAGPTDRAVRIPGAPRSQAHGHAPPDTVSAPEAAPPSPALAKVTPPAGEPAPRARPAMSAPAGALRTGEVIGRIWIAPFVDADGVYREAAHVQVVLEPAGWRLP